MLREHKERFQIILAKIAAKTPGISSIDVKETEDQRLLLRFNDGAFSDPFLADQMSDGTLKLFTYLLLLEDPDPPPLICIEEPENATSSRKACPSGALVQRPSRRAMR
jgi:predicted ATPase